MTSRASVVTTPLLRTRYAAEVPRRVARAIGVHIHPPKVMPLREMKDLALRAASGGGELAGGMVLLTRFEVDIHDSAVPYTVTMNVFALEGQLACESLTLHRADDGPAVTSSGLRGAVIDSYLSRIREELAREAGALLVLKPGVDRASGRTVFGVTQDDQQWGDFEKSQRRDRSGPDLREVARLYRAALASPDPTENRAPTATVAKKLHVHRGHAARLVSQARHAELLGKAKPGRFGEFKAEQGD